VPITALDDPEGAPDAGERSLAEYPLVERLSPLLSEDESAAEFEESLENLLERLQRVLRESRRPGSII
jgi:DNA-binding ferritin-like protein